MDPNQTVRTTPSRVNDVDPFRSNSGTETTPTGTNLTRSDRTSRNDLVCNRRIRNQRIANQTIANRLDQDERELAEHRAVNVRERNQTPLDPLRGTSNPQNTGLFGNPEIPSARSGCYTGENSQRLPPQGMTHRSLSYNGLDEIDIGLQRPRSTPIQFQNGSTERQGGTENTDPTAEPFDPQKSNSIRHEDLPPSRIR
ncbi:hypothetical protein F2Q68_00032407 [Brassica cretica]|uniref:Uncharacterized protein n=1 Tax=Brassica cretica TaxID=69181 RepID=A0A8S9G6Z0_BRACR|nr:hypothetical protein F2Q68_00032407 [Brassica cretica]